MLYALNCRKALSFSTTGLLNIYRKLSSRNVDDILVKGTWNPAPICPGRKMKDSNNECRPKRGSGDCEKNIGKGSDYMCCTDPHLTQECGESKKVLKKKKKQDIFKSMWETLPNFEKDCDLAPRLDDKLYKPSDKLKRVYRRTWEQCDEIKIRKKKVCCFEETPCLPPIYTRKSDQKSITACEQVGSELLKVNLTTLRECMRDMEKTKGMKCRKIRMPCCQPVAKNLKCLRVKPREPCERECTPYPSFSECVRDALRKGRPIECDCFSLPMQCEVLKFETYKKEYHIPPPLPAWPPVGPPERPK